MDRTCKMWINDAVYYKRLSSSIRQERDNAVKNCGLLEGKNLQLENSSNFWLLHAADSESQLNNVKQQLMDERRENLSNSLYINFLKGELLKLRITHHESSDLRKTGEELTQDVLRSEGILFSVDSILRDIIETHSDDNEFYSLYNPLVEIRESIEAYLYSVYQPSDTEDE
ncbi:MAG: hypothetical protein HOJ35_04880 [Bdellovibrionales bacterium]|nr:hypothetical protein [Bdellovibrionales bacterium]